MTTLPKNVDYFDSYGFAVFTERAGPDSERDHTYKNRSETCDVAYTAAWQKLLDNWEEQKATGSTKIDMFVRQGIPSNLRPAAWKCLLEVDSLKATSRFDYQVEIRAVREQLIDLGISEYSDVKAVNGLSDAEMGTYEVKFGQISMDALRHILLDLDRTYPTHRMFMGQTGEGKEGKAALFRVLAAYARYNPSVGYCQGMSSIAGVLLMHLPEEDAFWCTLSLLERHKYLLGTSTTTCSGMSSIAGVFLMHLPEEDAFWCTLSLLERHKYLLGYFDHHMLRIQKHAKVFEQLLTQRYPKLQSHLETLGVCALMFIPPWFISLFTSLPRWDTVLAIWDLLILQGNKTMFRVALAILSLIESDLLQAHELGTLLPQILHPSPARISYSHLIPTVWSLSMEDWEISSLMALLEEEGQKEGGRKRGREEGGDSLKRSSKRKRVDSSDTQPVKSWFSKVFGALSGPPSTVDTNPKSVLHRSAKRHKSPADDPKLTTRSRCIVGDSRRSSPLSSRQLKALHLDPHLSSPGRSGSSSATCEQGSARVTKRSTQLTADYLKRRLDRKARHKTGLTNHRRGFHTSPCEEMKENSSMWPMLWPTLRSVSRARRHNKLLDSASFRKASVQRSFKAFHTPKPLRVTQCVSTQAAPCKLPGSPEVELQSVHASCSPDKC
ncbi:hypothetical protein NP493_760g00032 [Ridgeia piscesae]|uniref:Rab-GAP TBC domain-containing protein n=1 Tax=Ridgeia piscesae TaxID=27915 RepID=A0AAD9NNK6_RIDPI|nr:hypothetical protein NP493_760g00032 [Ridgeia piscesae]